MIVFVQPVSGHAQNSNDCPPSCGITVISCIIGVGSACPSRTLMTRTIFCEASGMVGGNMVGIVHRCTCREGFAISVGSYIHFCSAMSCHRENILGCVQDMSPQGAFCHPGCRSRHIGQVCSAQPVDGYCFVGCYILASLLFYSQINNLPLSWDSFLGPVIFLW